MRTGMPETLSSLNAVAKLRAPLAALCAHHGVKGTETDTALSANISRRKRGMAAQQGPAAFVDDAQLRNGSGIALDAPGATAQRCGGSLQACCKFCCPHFSARAGLALSYSAAGCVGRSARGARRGPSFPRGGLGAG